MSVSHALFWQGAQPLASSPSMAPHTHALNQKNTSNKFFPTPIDFLQKKFPHK